MLDDTSENRFQIGASELAPWTNQIAVLSKPANARLASKHLFDNLPKLTIFPDFGKLFTGKNFESTRRPDFHSVSLFASFEVKFSNDHKSEYKPLILSLDLKNLFKRKINQEAVGFINSFDSSCGR